MAKRLKWALMWTWLLAPLLLLLGMTTAARASVAQTQEHTQTQRQTQRQTQPCTFHVLATSAARDFNEGKTRPTEGWTTVELPDVWSHRWPEHSGSVWYRIDWERRCPQADTASLEPTTIGFKRVFMAAEVFINDDFLWRDASLSDPITHGWNSPRWWTLPESTLRPGVNTVWVRVVGPVELTPGIDAMQIGPIDTIREDFAKLTWRRHTTFLISNAMSATLGSLFLAIWIRRRKEHIYGWFALMSFAWSLYLSTLLATAPWPVWPILVEGSTSFESSLRMARLNIVVMLLYIASFCLFSLRFSEQRLPRIERWLWVVVSLVAVAVICVPRSALSMTSFAAVVVCALIFFSVCIQVPVHTWRAKGRGRFLITRGAWEKWDRLASVQRFGVLRQGLPYEVYAVEEL